MKAVLTAILLAMSVSSAQAESYEGTVFSGRLERRYTVVMPDRDVEGRRVPTVIVLHGAMMSGKTMRRILGLEEVTERDGVAIVYPDSYGRTWNDGRTQDIDAPRDVHFIVQLARDLVDRGIADPDRIYLLGMSTGGMLTYRVACEYPRVFAAFAALVANMPKEVQKRCKPGMGVPMLIINSRNSRDLPDTSGPGDWIGGQVLTPNATVDFWRRNNGCEGPPQVRPMPDKDARDGSTVTAEQHQTCTSGAPVVSFMVDGSSQLPPGVYIGNRPLLQSVLGRPNGDVSSPEVAWKFFRRFPMR